MEVDQVPHSGLSAAVSCVRRVTACPAELPSDGQLVAAFLADRDADSFAALVRRYGSMVLGVCRRITGHAQDAEDAFQAVFVVLARRAADIAPRSAVGGWLYGVAVRTAQEARSVAAKRRTREALVPAVPDVGRDDPDPLSDEIRVILDEELGRLPEKHRALLVACDIEGMPQAEVARQLRLPVGTVYSRLSAARKLLAGRLRQRGVTLSAAGLVLALSRGVTAAVPAGLVTRTLAGFAGTSSASVSALVHGVMRTMFLQKLKAVPHGVLAVVTVLAGGWLVLPALEARETPKPAALPAPNPKPQPAAKPAGPNKILLLRWDRMTLIDPTGMNERAVLPNDKAAQPYRDAGRLSPDGKQVAFVAPDGTPNNPNPTAELGVAGVDDKEGQPLGVSSPRSFAWSPDGTEVAYTEFPTGGTKLTAVHGIVNVKTREKTVLKLPDDHYITDWSRDGKHFVTARVWPNAGIFLMDRDGTEHKALTEKRLPAGSYGLMGRLSPDGKRVLFTIVTPKDKGIEKTKVELAVLDSATGKVTPVADIPLNGEIVSYCWSPDGKRIAYLWGEVFAGKPEDAADKELESQLVVCDPDGKNTKTIVSEKKGQVNPIAGMDWR